MKKDIVLLDGAVGTSLWEKADKYGFPKNPVWLYNVEHPEIVKELAAEYLDAGSQIILANTFGANGPAVKRSSAYTTPEIVKAGVRLAREAVGGKAEVSLSVGPLSALRFAAKLAVPDAYEKLLADVDFDSSVTVADALAILRVAAKLADHI